ncbi:MAG: RHS repeat domain-containing protein [Pyrinomonadaceae bacterium]
MGTVQNGFDKLKLNFDYGTTQNNGNVLSQQITVPTVGANQGFVATQNYTYDSLNRLKSAAETISSQTWKQTFLYDRYGNRNFDTANTTTLGSCPANQCNPTIDAANNRFTTGQGYTYDLAGNVITDAEGRTFVYDAENKQKEVRDVNNVVVGQYYYDGDGKRVKKYIFSTQETTLFVYDASGKMVAEYATTVAPSSEAKVSYLTSDHLGSPRITTDANGGVTSRRDFLPFGEETFTAQRTNGLGYTADEVRQKFTSYEKDNETELNYAKARYQNPNLGRFNSPDPAKMTKARMVDPQHWNLYVYARNNPILMVDVTGEFPWTFYIRSFIYTSMVGPGGTFRGDGRTPSLETNPDIASSRVRLNFTLDYDKGQITNSFIRSDPTKFYGVGGIGGTDGTGTPGVDFGNVETSNRSKVVSLHYWGKDPITPGFATPDLDVHATIGISESINKDGTGKLFVAGTFTGDKFPSTEAFIVDQSGKTKLFLGAKLEEGGVSDLYGDNQQNLFKVDFQVRFDKKGNFTAVIQDGKTYTVDEWNKRVQAQF